MEIIGPARTGVCPDGRRLGGLHLKNKKFLLDTHALLFWLEEESISHEFVNFLDKQGTKGNLLFSSVSIWEIALLVKKGRIHRDNLHKWKNDVLNYSPAKMIDPTATDMIESTLLPDIHKDPFDRILIAQTISNDAILVTKDKSIQKYQVDTLWK